MARVRVTRLCFCATRKIAQRRATVPGEHHSWSTLCVMWLIISLARASAHTGDVSLTNRSRRFRILVGAEASDLQQQKRDVCILRRITWFSEG
jgi:hypothetical protein